MEHNEAQQNEAVDRYLLNEMSEAEADAFEAHFFDCSRCAEEVRAGSRMITAGQAAARRESAKVVPIRRPFLTYLASAASVVFALLAANAYLRVIPPLRQQLATAAQPAMEVVPYDSVSVATSRSGGEESKVIAIPVAKPATLYLNAAPDPEIARYDIELRKDDGKVSLRSTASVTPEQSITLLLRSLPAGSYVLAIHGVRTDGNRTGDAAQYTLKVQ
jgi:Putative zinc-finger